jgi:hypothetical protein
MHGGELLTVLCAKRTCCDEDECGCHPERPIQVRAGHGDSHEVRFQRTQEAAANAPHNILQAKTYKQQQQ